LRIGVCSLEARASQDIQSVSALATKNSCTPWAPAWYARSSDGVAGETTADACTATTPKIA
jgi:hypothetical protein